MIPMCFPKTFDKYIQKVHQQPIFVLDSMDIILFATVYKIPNFG